MTSSWPVDCSLVAVVTVTGSTSDAGRSAAAVGQKSVPAGGGEGGGGELVRRIRRVKHQTVVQDIRECLAFLSDGDAFDLVRRSICESTGNRGFSI